jgi:hypothetical protein
MLLIKLMLWRKIMLLDIVLFSTQYSINMLLICIIDSQPNSSRRFTYKSSEKLCISISESKFLEGSNSKPWSLQYLVYNVLYCCSRLVSNYVGSKAEGFRITGSDIDRMIVVKDKTFITMETQHTKPGYVRLILETDKSRTSSLSQVLR